MKSKSLCPFTHLAECFGVFFLSAGKNKQTKNSADGYWCQFNADWGGQSQTVMWWGWPSVLFCADLSGGWGKLPAILLESWVSLKDRKAELHFPQADVDCWARHDWSLSLLYSDWFTSPFSSPHIYTHAAVTVNSQLPIKLEKESGVCATVRRPWFCPMVPSNYWKQHRGHTETASTGYFGVTLECSANGPTARKFKTIPFQTDSWPDA